MNLCIRLTCVLSICIVYFGLAVQTTPTQEEHKSWRTNLTRARSDTDNVNNTERGAEIGPPQPLEGLFFLIQPTIIRAAKTCQLVDKGKHDCKYRISTRVADYDVVLDRLKDKFVGRGIEKSSFASVGDSLQYGHLISSQNAEDEVKSPTLTSYEQFKDYSLRNFQNRYGQAGSLGNMLLDRGWTCVMDVPSGAEFFLKNQNYYYVGVHENKVCIARFPAGFQAEQDLTRNLEKHMQQPNATVYPNMHTISVEFYGNGSHFKISALAVGPTTQDADNSQIMLFFDESGQVSSRRVKFLKPQDESKKNETWSHSLGVLANKPEGYVSPVYPRPPIPEFDDHEQDLKMLREQFDLAFVESITLFKQTLCFSRGLKVQPGPIVRCLSSHGRAVLPANLIQPDKEFAILALEVVEVNATSTNYHVVHEYLENGLSFISSPRYWFCSVKPSDVYDGPKWQKNINKTSCFLELDLARIPIDIVAVKRKSCRHLVTFYRYMYQMNEIGEPITKAGKLYPADWMNFDANAVLAHRKKLYFFLSGNVLLTFNVKQSDCGELTVSGAKYFFTSTLIQAFGRSLLSNNRLTRSAAGPIKNFENHTFDSSKVLYTGFTEYSIDKGWRPDFKFNRQLDKRTELSLNESLIDDDDYIEDPKTGNSAMLMFGLLVIIVLLILVCVLFYLFSGRKKDAYEMDEPNSLITRTSRGSKSGGKSLKRSNLLEPTQTLRSSVSDVVNSMAKHAKHAKDAKQRHEPTKSILKSSSKKSTLNKHKSKKSKSQSGAMKSPSLRPSRLQR